MNIREFLENNIVILDGGMGTLLQKEGLVPGEHPEMWNINHADVITKIHRDYFDAGSLSNPVIVWNNCDVNYFNIISFAKYTDLGSAATNLRVAPECLIGTWR